MCENVCFTIVFAHFAVWGRFCSHRNTMLPMQGTIYENWSELGGLPSFTAHLSRVARPHTPARRRRPARRVTGQPCWALGGVAVGEAVGVLTLQRPWQVSGRGRGRPIHSYHLQVGYFVYYTYNIICDDQMPYEIHKSIADLSCFQTCTNVRYLNFCTGNHADLKTFLPPGNWVLR